jgi:hypothetical protein
MLYKEKSGSPEHYLCTYLPIATEERAIVRGLKIVCELHAHMCAFRHQTRMTTISRHCHEGSDLPMSFGIESFG